MLFVVEGWPGLTAYPFLAGLFPSLCFPGYTAVPVPLSAIATLYFSPPLNFSPLSPTISL